MTKIDPILPLAVQIAEGRGQFAFFLGSGVSRAARIPSGWCALKDLYRMQENVEKIGMFQKIVYISAEGKKGMEGREVKEGKEYTPLSFLSPLSKCQLIFEKI